MLDPRCKLWLESGGAVAISDYRLRLLRLVVETGSLSEAAARMGLSYRRAWGKVRDMERTVGVRLVESHAGGATGGGSRLTDAGADLVTRYARFADEARQAVAAAFDREFNAPVATDPATLRSDRGGPR